jgi:nitrogen fixation/metabolism regulation signal transduction histidine kinase
MIKRKKRLIEPRFQATVVLYSFALSLISLVVFYAGYCISFYRLIDAGIDGVDVERNLSLFHTLSQQAAEISTVFIGTSVISLIVNVIFGIIFSHRLVGPLYRLKTHLSLCADQHTLKKVSFRKKDYFQDVADSFNQFTDTYTNGRNVNETPKDC